MRVVRHGADAVIALDDGPPVNFCKPAVDPLFTSAIDVWQGGILAVVLTGMGSDGMRGGKDIVAAGGSVIAQDEASSVVWGMPGAAAQCRHLRGRAAARSDRAEAGSLVLGRSFVTPLGLRVSAQAPEGALRSRSVRRQAISGREPADPAGAQGRPCRHRRTGRRRSRPAPSALTSEVVEAMTTNETFFFRDKIPFEHLRETIMPALLQARASRRSLRIWCAASSTGQEPYSIAMCLKEMGAALAGWRIEIVATDLSQEVLEKSKAGIFSQFEVQRGLPIQMLVKYFTQIGELWQINADIRAMVQFRQLNLLQDFSHLGTFDLVFCRNVLIYFDQDTKVGVFERLAKAIEPDGFLVLGAAETVVGITDAFKPYPERRGLYAERTMPDAAASRGAYASARPAMSAAFRAEVIRLLRRSAKNMPTKSCAAETATYCR